MGGLDVISAESIYKYIYGNKERGVDLHTYLRCQKTYRKRGKASQEHRGQIQNIVSIHERDFEILRDTLLLVKVTRVTY